jgi:glycosyltransferase involved in cell wall biosynthesis
MDKNNSGSGNMEVTAKERFRSIVLYPFPAELDGVSLQGEYLYRGLKENKYPVMPCNRISSFEKKFLYKTFRPAVAIGVGFWGDVPELVHEPLKHGVTPVPWFNADGWVANYHDALNELPLILVTSKWVKETYMRDGVFNENIRVVPIGIDTQEIKPIPKSDHRVVEMRRMLGVEPHEKMILTAGGDTTSKGFQEVLKALGKVDHEFSDWKYIGKSWDARSPYYHYKEELNIINEMKLSRKKVRYIGGALSREGLNVLLAAADVYAAPSRIEGFGMIQVEAQAAGIPVLSVDAMGVKDTVVHKKTGFLAAVGEKIELEEEWVYRDMGFRKKKKIRFDQPKTFAVRADVDELAGYLLKLLSEDSLRDSMGRDARKHTVEKFDYRRTSADLASIVESKIDL